MSVIQLESLEKNVHFNKIYKNLKKKLGALYNKTKMEKYFPFPGIWKKSPDMKKEMKMKKTEGSI